VVVQLLPFSRQVTYQGAPCYGDIGPRTRQGLINKEILLLPAKGGIYFIDAFVEIPGHGGRGFINRSQGTEEGCLIIQGFPGIGHKNGWDA